MKDLVMRFSCILCLELFHQQIVHKKWRNSIAKSCRFVNTFKTTVQLDKESSLVLCLNMVSPCLVCLYRVMILGGSSHTTSPLLKISGFNKTGIMFSDSIRNKGL